jgi:hypothetical protein
LAQQIGEVQRIVRQRRFAIASEGGKRTGRWRSPSVSSPAARNPDSSLGTAGARRKRRTCPGRNVATKRQPDAASAEKHFV